MLRGVCGVVLDGVYSIYAGGDKDTCLDTVCR